MKKIRVEQLLLMIFAGLYLLETFFITGMFTNIPLYFITLVLGVIALISASIRKQYKWIAIDILICLLCTGIVSYLVVF